jgi:hypothetical protein
MNNQEVGDSIFQEISEQECKSTELRKLSYPEFEEAEGPKRESIKISEGPKSVFE